MQASMAFKQHMYTRERDSLQQEILDAQVKAAAFVSQARSGGLADSQTPTWEVVERVSNRWQALVLQSAALDRVTRTTVAAAAKGRMVHWRMRPREDGSTMSAGRADLKTSSNALYSASVMRLAATDALLTTRVVAPMPAVFIIFQMGPLDPSDRP